MAANSKIEWTDATFNPWVGCTKVSPGCANCYAETLMDKRWGKVKWGKGNPRQRTSEANWKEPLKWNRQGLVCVDCGTHRGPDGDCECGQIGAIGKVRCARVFCASSADWLDDEVPIESLADSLKLIAETQNLNWQLLTKRPENFRARMKQVFDLEPSHLASNFAGRWYIEGIFPSNVWIGASVEDQEWADARIPLLQSIPAKVRFLSVEPMLRPITFKDLTGIHWAIFGGESGPGARVCDVEWIRDGVRQCRDAGVRVFVKQLGSSAVDLLSPATTRLKWLKDRKGGDMSEWPEDLRIREFPV